MIPVYADGQIIGEVIGNETLDYWDGYNYTCGSPGSHKGLEMFNGQYVFVHTTQRQEEKDTAEVITPEQAVQEILKSGNTELFNQYPELQAIREDLKSEKILIKAGRKA